MRIWQRRAIACTFTPERSVMVSEKVRVGVAAYRSAVAPVQPNMRSAMSVPSRPRHRAPPQPGQEGRQGRAGFRSAVEALPSHPQFADQRVALVDRDQEDLILRGGQGGNG